MPVNVEQLTSADLIEPYGARIAKQVYEPAQTIADVLIDEAKVHRGTDGAFVELLRLGDDGEVQGVPAFRARQWSWSLLQPGAVKAWHLHLLQDDLWIVPPGSLVLVGLIDLRRDSPTATQRLRAALGGGRCQRLFIPKGVAHGVANLTTQVQVLLYAGNRLFSPDPEVSDEWRLPADCFGAEFWQMDRD